MTLDLREAYPGQVITTDPDYPLGKARNRVHPGDGTGTPYEAKLVNDLHGSHQALLDAAGITASGEPDRVGASDVVDSIQALIVEQVDPDLTELNERVDEAEEQIGILWSEVDNHTTRLDRIEEDEGDITDAILNLQESKHGTSITVSGSGVGVGDKFTLTSVVGDTSYPISDNEITVPQPGLYSISMTLTLTSVSTSPVTSLVVALLVGGSVAVSPIAVRYSDSPSVRAVLSWSELRQISTPSTQRLSLTPGAGMDALSAVGATSRINVFRIA